MNAISFLLLLWALINGSADPVEKDFKALSVTTIQNMGDNYFLSVPIHISTDSRDHIYVADYYSLDIKMFDSRGRFIKNIGGRGRGPGEFYRITEMHVDDRDQVVVADQFLYRITVFDTDHKEKITRLYKSWEIMWPQGLIDFNDSYLLLYRLPIPADLEEETAEFSLERREFLFHMMDQDLEAIGPEFGKYSLLNYSEDRYFSRYTEGYGGYIQQYDEESVLFSHRLYDGSLYRFSLDGSLSTHAGYTLHDKPFIREFTRPFSEQARVGSGKDGTVAAVINAESAGLYRLDSGRYIHFSRQRVGMEMHLYVELFDKQLNLIRYGRLKGFENSQLRVDHYSRGRFFAINYIDGEGRVQMFRMEGVE